MEKSILKSYFFYRKVSSIKIFLDIKEINFWEREDLQNAMK